LGSWLVRHAHTYAKIKACVKKNRGKNIQSTTNNNQNMWEENGKHKMQPNARYQDKSSYTEVEVLAVGPVAAPDR
jgi:hypothetical protein